MSFLDSSHHISNMIPRLAPRRSPRRIFSLESSTGVENSSPYMSSLSSVGGVAPIKPATTIAMLEDKDEGTNTNPPLQLQEQTPRGVLCNKNTAALLNPPLSPSPMLLEPELVEPLMKSPKPQDIQSNHDWSSISDCSITPPVTGPRPLVVSAKRLGNAVRRRHSSKRRRRRKNDTEEDGSSSSSTALTGGYCLWKDANAPPNSQDSSSDEDEDLPFLFGATQPLSEAEKQEFWWETCYGKKATVTTTIELPTCVSGWSASRKPPAKGCLSTKKGAKVATTAADKFKTPPTSPDEVEAAAAAAATAAADNTTSNKKAFRVQFGSPQAAEYVIDDPVAQLTPLPSEFTRRRYSMTEKEVSKEEEEMTVETKRNSALLAEWEDDLAPTSSAARRRQQRKNRRSSSLFTPSPMSSLLNNDDEEEEVSDRRRAPSPSTIVMENLASLCVDSPLTSTSMETNCSVAESCDDVDSVKNAPPSLTPVSMGSDDSSSSSGSSSSAGENKTAQFAISLDSVNVTGGAMDTTTPPRLELQSTTTTSSVSSALSADTTTPPPNMSLDTIHSVGGALDQASPATHMLSKVAASIGHSPISRMSGSSHTSKDGHVYLDAIATSTPVDIVSMLIEDPTLDQTWPAKDVFQNLAERKPKAKSRVSTLLEALGPQFDGVLSCIEDLKEQATFCASTKSSTKFQLPASEAPYARKLAVREWKEMETEFLLELSQALERNADRAMQILQNAGSFLKRIKTQPDNSKPKAPTQELEQEVLSLEKQVKKYEELARVQEAADAPFASLRCQATSLIGICGFRLDQYTGTCLQLSYEHPIAGVESQFLVEMAQNTWNASYVTDAFVSSPNLLPAAHVAAKFHESIAKHSFEDPNGILQLVEGQPVQEAVMLLSRWLGLLDAAAQDLANVSPEYSVTLEWPMLIISKRDDSTGGILKLVYGERGSRSMVPSNAIVSRTGNDDEQVSVPSQGGGSILKSLFESVNL